MNFSKYEVADLPFPSANRPEFRERYLKWEEDATVLFEEKLKAFEVDALNEFGLSGHPCSALIWGMVWSQVEDGRMLSNIERAYEVLSELVDVFTAPRR
jgi:hypothetical protein